MERPCIVYFQESLALGACEEYFYLLMHGIDRVRFNIIFVCPEGSILDSLVRKIEALGIKVQRYSLNTNNYLVILRLLQIFREFKPELVHINDPCLTGIIAARLANVPVLLITHHTPELNRKYNYKGKLLEKIMFRYAGLNFIFTSEFDRETGIKKDKVSADKSFVIYHGLPPEKFSQRYDKKEVYNEFSLSEDCRIIANIGRLSPQKGQIYLIEAATFIIERFKSVRFFFVGEGELESELKAEVRKRGLQDYFIFTGHRTDIPRLLSAFEMLVMPSLFEGLCFAVIEASAMGIPVIATAVGGMRRSVMDGKSGILIPVQDAQTLAKAITWMLEHPQEARQMGIAGKKHFLELFTQESMVKKTEELYRGLLTKNYYALSKKE